MSDDPTMPGVPQPSAPKDQANQPADADAPTVFDFEHQPPRTDTKTTLPAPRRRGPKAARAPEFSRAYVAVSVTAVGIFVVLLAAAIAWLAFGFPLWTESAEKGGATKPSATAPTRPAGGAGMGLGGPAGGRGTGGRGTRPARGSDSASSPTRTAPERSAGQ